MGTGGWGPHPCMVMVAAGSNGSGWGGVGWGGVGLGWWWWWGWWGKGWGVEVMVIVLVMLRLQASRPPVLWCLSRWWNQQTPAAQAATQALVNAGQLEFVNGGWCMHDEAAPHYVDMIDQTTLGHMLLLEEFGPAGIPTIGWQIDPCVCAPHRRPAGVASAAAASVLPLLSCCRCFFSVCERRCDNVGCTTTHSLRALLFLCRFGHSATNAALLSAEVGFNGLFFGRIDHQDHGGCWCPCPRVRGCLSVPATSVGRAVARLVFL